MSHVEASEGCFHCQLPIPSEDKVIGTIDGEEQHFCC
ncbi:MAG: heavy metal translocating P-type ATPase metal-binding domain-containing protein, partial [Candidatus Thiodiazotropha taylori]